MRRGVAVMAGGLAGAALAFGAGFLFPETPYETVLGWMAIAAGLGGVAGFVVARQRRRRDRA